MPESYQISDDSDLRKFRTEIPNIIDDLGLNPYQRTLYTHYKRVCGANGGRCTEGTRMTAKKTGMSQAKVSTTREELATKGLVEKIEQSQYIHIRIMDIWELNFAYYSIQKRPDISGWTIPQLDIYIKSVHHTNGYYVECSPREQSVHHVNALAKKRSPRETKKEHDSKKEPIKETMPQFEPLMVAIAKVCGFNLQTIARATARELVNTHGIFSSQNITPAQVLEFDEWRQAHHWSRATAPTLKQLCEYWGQYESWVNLDRPAPTYKNGANQNGHKHTNDTNPDRIDTVSIDEWNAADST